MDSTRPLCYLNPFSHCSIAVLWGYTCSESRCLSLECWVTDLAVILQMALNCAVNALKVGVQVIIIIHPIKPFYLFGSRKAE